MDRDHWVRGGWLENQNANRLGDGIQKKQPRTGTRLLAVLDWLQGIVLRKWSDCLELEKMNLDQWIRLPGWVWGVNGSECRISILEPHQLHHYLVYLASGIVN